MTSFSQISYGPGDNSGRKATSIYLRMDFVYLKLSNWCHVDIFRLTGFVKSENIGSILGNLLEEFKRIFP